MSKSSMLLFGLLFLLGNQAQAQPKVDAIRARLFYNERSEQKKNDVSGELSPNMIDDKNVGLWNTTIGAGWAEGYSNDTLVIVEISAPGMSNQDQVLRLSITQNGKTTTQKQTFSCINCTSTYKVPFLIYGTGCDVLTLKAELLKGKKSISTLTKSVPFACGE